jgi:uncharacterized protein (DUF927 family)
VSEDGGFTEMLGYLHEPGDFAVWKDMMTKLRKNPFARFITSASFASPLSTQMGSRSFAIYIWWNSGSGKTAVLKAALSVWDNPETIMMNCCTTKTAWINTRQH